MDVVIQKAENPSQQSTQIKKKRKVSAVSCTVYKPFEEQTASLNLPSTLSPLFEELDLKPGFLRIWPDKMKTFLWLEFILILRFSQRCLKSSTISTLTFMLVLLFDECKILEMCAWVPAHKIK